MWELLPESFQTEGIFTGLFRGAKNSDGDEKFAARQAIPADGFPPHMRHDRLK